MIVPCWQAQTEVSTGLAFFSSVHLTHCHFPLCNKIHQNSWCPKLNSSFSQLELLFLWLVLHLVSQLNLLFPHLPSYYAYVLWDRPISPSSEGTSTPLLHWYPEVHMKGRPPLCKCQCTCSAIHECPSPCFPPTYLRLHTSYNQCLTAPQKRRKQDNSPWNPLSPLQQLCHSLWSQR